MSTPESLAAATSPRPPARTAPMTRPEELLLDVAHAWRRPLLACSVVGAALSAIGAGGGLPAWAGVAAGTLAAVSALAAFAGAVTGVARRPRP